MRSCNSPLSTLIRKKGNVFHFSTGRGIMDSALAERGPLNRQLYIIKMSDKKERDTRYFQAERSIH